MGTCLTPRHGGVLPPPIPLTREAHVCDTCATGLRELSTAEARGLPLVCVHESDPTKNGAPLPTLREACPEAFRAYAFAGAPLVAWHRVRDFQLVALAHVAERLVAASGGAGAADSEGKQVRLAVKGGLAWASLSFARPVDVYTSPHEPRGAAVLAQLRERHEDAVRSTQRLDEGVPWLLCLSAHCFEGDVGALLVEEVRERGGRGTPCAHPLATHPLPPFPRPHHR